MRVIGGEFRSRVLKSLPGNDVRPTPDRIILRGINEFKDSIFVVLDRSDKKYPLVEGRQSAISAY